MSGHAITTCFTTRKKCRLREVAYIWRKASGADFLNMSKGFGKVMRHSESAPCGFGMTDTIRKSMHRHEVSPSPSEYHAGLIAVIRQDTFPGMRPWSPSIPSARGRCMRLCLEKCIPVGPVAELTVGSVRNDDINTKPVRNRRVFAIETDVIALVRFIGRAYLIRRAIATNCRR